jgi:undecaprenyl-diphosphatase
MSYTRVRYLISVLLAGAVWLAAMFLGGKGWPPDEKWRAILATTDPAMQERARWLAWIGEWQVLTAAAVIAAVILAFTRRRRAALLLIMIVVGRLLVEIQRLVTVRAPPDVAAYLESVAYASFPSVQAANAMITYVAIAALLPIREWLHYVLIVVVVLLAGLAGWSQLALRVSWPSDVVGGWAFGLLWVMVCVRLATDRPGK